MLINSFDGQGVILDNSSDTSNTKSNLSTSIYINYILLYEYSGEVKKNQKGSSSSRNYRPEEVPCDGAPVNDVPRGRQQNRVVHQGVHYWVQKLLWRLKKQNNCSAAFI